MKEQRVLTAAGLVITDLATLTLLRPDFGRLAADLGAPHAWFARVGVDGALARLAATGLWLAAAWLALGLGAAGVSRLPGLAGRLGAGVAKLLLPRAVRGVLAGCAGLGVLLAPVAAGATSPQRVASTAVSAYGAAALPSPGWPVSADPLIADPLPTPTWPVEHHPNDVGRASARQTTVRPGDSLWIIAGRRLGSHVSPAQIAAAWPRWYAANRDVIGADPALIVPGQVLHAPPTVTEESSR